MINEADLEEWCDEQLPELYDVGMFDNEDTHDDVWEAFNQLADETYLEFIEDEEEQEEMRNALLEAAEEWFKGHHAAMIDTMEPPLFSVISELLNKPQVAQHTADWYAQRRNRLTASEFSQILDGRRGALLRSKLDTSSGDRPSQAPVALAQEDGEMVATSWGHRFEPIVRRIYELEIAGLDTVCDTMGRLTHKTVPWLSASPDGLVTKGPLAGRLVEIKAPKTRQPGKFVPHEYYVQMQVQMEVCDLDAVDFIEAQFKQRPGGVETDQDRIDLDVAPWKGVINVYGDFDDPTTWRYVYSEPVEDLEDVEMPEEPADQKPLLESTVWWLSGWYPRTVLRSPEWWGSVGWPAAELFWAQVQSGREAATADDTITMVDSADVGGWLGSK
jgi:hypothetical protein